MDSKKGGKGIDGMKQASELLAGLDEAHRSRILNEIAVQNPAMAEKLSKSLFSFQHVLGLPVLELHKVLKEVEPDLIPLSLRGLEPQALDQFLKGFTERQGKAIRESMLAQGPRKISDVKVAQEKITEIAQRLHENGEINLKRS